MTTAKEAVRKALAPKAVSMPAAQVNIATWEKWFEFRTLGDPQREAMLRAAVNFVLEVKARRGVPWLVLLGTSGAGKSHLAKRIWRWWQKIGGWNEGSRGNSFCMSGQLCKWADYLAEAKGGDFSRADDLARERFVVLDDIGAGAEAKGWIADKLYHIIETRMSARPVGDSEDSAMTATIITANLSLEQIADQLDSRIASRLVRQGREKVLTVELPDFKMID